MTISSATFNSLRPGSLVGEKAKNVESAKENERPNKLELEKGRGRDVTQQIPGLQFFARLALIVCRFLRYSQARGELSANMKTVLFGQFFSAGNEIA